MSMEKSSFEIEISASREAVWAALWNDHNYREWTSAFIDGSYAESDWMQGSEIRFLSPKNSGMLSRIIKKDDNVAMVFEHEKEILNGELREIPWKGAQESYFLFDKNGGTLLRCTLDVSAEFKDYFSTVFPLALQKVKEIAERDSSRR